MTALPGMPDAARSEAAYFDTLISEQGEFDPFADRAWRTLARRYRAFVPPDDAREVLDVGCGTGQSRQLYAGATRRYVGVDLSFNAVAAAKRKFPHDSWCIADATQLPFRAGQFQVIAFSSVLHHIGDYVVALREGLRVLRPGGYAFAFDPNLLHPAMALLRWPRSPWYSAKGVSPNERPLLPRSLRTAFRAAGFVQLKQRCQADIPYRQIALGVPPVALRLYNAGDWLLERIGLGRWFGSFVITRGRRREA